MASLYGLFPLLTLTYKEYMKLLYSGKQTYVLLT